jgi:broad specificity phosphatase PhoE
MKRIVFLRHAQSEENVKYEHLHRTLSSLRHLRMPSMTHIYDSVSLLQINLNAKLSDLGRRQIDDVRRYFEESNFWTSFDPQLLIHSNLNRTKETLYGVIPSSLTDEANGRPEIKELSALHELYPLEYLFSQTLYERQRRFKQFLDTIDAERILIVGHGRYLKLLLGEEHELRNVDVIEVNYISSSDPSKTGSFDRSSIKRIYRSPLSTPHPSESVRIQHASSSRSRNSQEDLANVVNDLQGEDEPTCRICQVTFASNHRKQNLMVCLWFVNVDDAI